MEHSTQVIITQQALSVPEYHKYLPRNPACGAVVWFDGVVRNHNEGQGVTGIEYTCYETMARKELLRIAAEIREQWPVQDMCIVHRIGQLSVGDSSLVMGINSPHRHDALAATDAFIVQMKQRVPIWKKEQYVDNAPQWLSA